MKYIYVNNVLIHQTVSTEIHHKLLIDLEKSSWSKSIKAEYIN